MHAQIEVSSGVLVQSGRIYCVHQCIRHMPSGGLISETYNKLVFVRGADAVPAPPDIVRRRELESCARAPRRAASPRRAAYLTASTWQVRRIEAAQPGAFPTYPLLRYAPEPGPPVPPKATPTSPTEQRRSLGGPISRAK